MEPGKGEDSFPSGLRARVSIHRPAGRTRRDEEHDAEKDDQLSPTGIWGSCWRLYAALSTFRVLNCLLVQSSFVPDEYWQSLEVAHALTFGYGHLTWEWREGIRGYAYPFAIALQYKLLTALGLESTTLLIWLPRLSHALLAAFADLKLYHTASDLSGARVARWVLLCQLCSWFTWYSCTRTLTNSVEASLTCIAMAHLPWASRSPRSSMVRSVCVLVLAVLVRPTAAVPWLLPVAVALWRQRPPPWAPLGHLLAIGLAGLTASLLIDRMCYGEWVCVQLRFFLANAARDIGSFYGSHPWHWYLSQGLPAVLGPLLPLAIAGWRHAPLAMRGAVLVTLLTYSLLSHKEFRFIYPVLPFCLIMCGHSLRRLWCPGAAWGLLLAARRGLALVLLLSSLMGGLYLGLVHQRGTLDVMGDVRALCGPSEAQRSVWFLTPCHSTPLYSHVHCRLDLRILECPPDLDGNPDYREEVEEFYREPVQWLRAEFSVRGEPSHVVLFNVLEPVVEKFLAERGFVRTASHFHTHFPEGRLGSHIGLFERQNVSQIAG
ncbi:GPI mannosyltransferase 3 [Lethenteron reissneri]|uniref:GPI mannosyltransferase 3 n=1 Tax=Lethenteron reissneri TaxID=7753 RepID=UPI002AB61EA3|nr:GPI mannosyltransferase 3 [Lethenteron reissneri]